MKHTQISIAERRFYSSSPAPYRFLFRTDWMEPDEANLLLPLLQARFPAPLFQITINERTTTHTMQTL
jgi:hypothetical protein